MAKNRIPSDYKNDVSRSNHNWSLPVHGTVHPCVAVPTHFRRMNPGDRIRGNPEALIQSHPMQGPLLHGFKYVTYATFLPDSAIYGWKRTGFKQTPKQLLDKDKFYYSPITMQSIAAYPDPFFGRQVTASPLVPGTNTSLAVANDVPRARYKAWVVDYYDAKLGTRHNHIGRGGLWDWLGMAPGSVIPSYSGSSTATALRVTPSWQWHIAPALAYFLSCYYYIANMQEDCMFYTRGSYDLYKSFGSGSAPFAPNFKDVFNAIDPATVLAAVNELAAKSTTRDSYIPDIQTALSSLQVVRNELNAWLNAGTQGYGGLFSVPYSPDLFGNIIKAGESPSAYVEVVNEDDSPYTDSIAIPELRLKTKIQAMLDRLFVSRGRWGDVLRSLWGLDSNPYVDKPQLLGVWQSYLDPTNTVATAVGQAGDSSSDVGQMAGRIDKFSSFKGKDGIDFTARDSGTLMFITMIVPQPSYCQGLNPDLLAGSFADDFNPEMNGIGFTTVPRHRYSTLPESFENGIWSMMGTSGAAYHAVDPNQVVVGEEAAWSWLRTDYGRLHGDFAQNGMYQYWTLVRRFTEYYDSAAGDDGSVTINPATFSYYGTYGNPLAWQYLFVGQSFLDANFILVANYDLTVTNDVSKHYMPYLGR